MSPVDTALLKRWTEHRDAEAFNDLVSRHADLVYATCKRILGNPAEAEDVAQECFLKLATSGARVRSSLGGWLHSVATSLAINRIRAEARRRKREHAAATEAPLITDPQWDDIQRYVDEAIADLPDKLREPLIRHFLQRQTHDEIARDLGVTRSGVTKRITTGVERVRANLRRNGIAVTGTILTALVAEHAADAAPASLTAGLGRLALSGVAKPAALGGIVSAMTLAKIALTTMVAMAIGAASIIGYNHWTQTSASSAAENTTSEPSNESQAAQATPPDDPISETAPAHNLTPSAEQAAVPPTRNPQAPYLTGVVRNNSGDPVAGAIVEVRYEKAWNERFSFEPQIAAHMVTAADGAFTLDRLPQWKGLILVVKHPDYADYVEQIYGFHDAGHIRQGLTCVLDPPISLSGRVEDDANHPVPDATVVLWNLIPSKLLDTDPKKPRRVSQAITFGALQTARTDAEGQFTLSHLGNGYIIRRISAHKGGSAFGFAPGRVPPESWVKSRYPWNGTAFAVAANENVTIKLGKPSVIEGHVVNRADGKPAAGVTVAVEGYMDLPRGAYPEQIFDWTTTRDDGTYRFDTLRSIAWKVLAIRGQEVAEAYEYRLTPEQTLENIDFHIGPGASIQGVLYDAESERPLPNTSVGLSETNLSGQSRSAQSDANGRYQFPQLHGGVWQLRAGPERKIDHEHHPAVVFDFVEVSLQPGEVATTNLYMTSVPRVARPPIRLTITVTDDHAHPVSGAVVYGPSRGSGAITDEKGRVEIPALQEGRTTLLAEDNVTHKMGKTEVSIAEGNNVAKIVLDAQASTISGRVTGLDAQLEDYTTKIVFRDAYQLNKTADIGSDGTYTSPLLPEGRIEVVVRDPINRLKFDPDYRGVILQAGKSVTGVDFAVVPMTEKVSGAVVRPDGAPVVGSQVALEGWSVNRRTTTDGQGRFEFTNVAGEDLKLSVGHDSEPDHMSIRTAAGVENLRLVLETGGVIRGSVLLTEDQRAALATYPQEASLCVAAWRTDSGKQWSSVSVGVCSVCSVVNGL
ncbi:MAG: sigma-70 family RNA polymerase sigma factor [Candidatus Hydrogenedentes bacterium]|nr:sigma-70 family RNA polymerase sigma factor [Candidatus Hydrogenedentota bacterium]